MKTFFAFTTGLLGGTIFGMWLMSVLELVFPELREFTNKLAEELHN